MFIVTYKLQIKIHLWGVLYVFGVAFILNCVFK